MMYARPELNAALARLWTSHRCSFKARGIDAPARLSQSAEEFSVWEDPALVFSQTCGMPLRTRLRGKVRLVGTPDYGLEGCAPGYYRSAIVVRADDWRTNLTEYASARLAFNMPHSHSGLAAFYTHVRPLQFWFADRVQSGSHLRSVAMIAAGQADIAAVDAQTWRLIERYDPMPQRMRVLEHTAPTPGLPLITGLHHDPDVIFDAVQEAVSMVNDADATLLDLQGIVRIPEAAYLTVPNPPLEAAP